ncbi:MAG: hypothetical protein ACFCUX_01410 [Candidatus Methylacidiphilales bacterium]
MRYILPSLLLVILLFPELSRAEPKIVKFSLIHAQNADIEESLPIEPELRKSLQRLFGYQKFRVLGEARSQVSEGESIRFQPNTLFYLKFQRLSTEPLVYAFDLMEEEISLLKGNYTPKPKIPLIIRGPFYAKGNLVLVIECQHGK